MSLQTIRGGHDLDAFETLVEALRSVIEQIVDERHEKHAEGGSWRWLTAPQAGVILGISAAAVGARVRQGTLPGRLYGRRIYVDREALDAAIDSATFPALSLDFPTEQREGRAAPKSPRP